MVSEAVLRSDVPCLHASLVSLSERAIQSRSLGSVRWRTTRLRRRYLPRPKAWQTMGVIPGLPRGYFFACSFANAAAIAEVAAGVAVA